MADLETGERWLLYGVISSVTSGVTDSGAGGMNGGVNEGVVGGVTGGGAGGVNEGVAGGLTGGGAGGMNGGGAGGVNESVNGGVTGAAADLPPPRLELRPGGAFGQACTVLTGGPLAAIGARLPAELQVAQPTTADLLAYSRVIEHVHEQTTIVPLRFGSVLHSAAAVRSYLAENAAAYEQLLARLAGTEELAVRIVIAPPPAPSLPPHSPPSAAGIGAAYLRARQLRHAQAAQQRAAGEARAEWLRAALMPQARAHRTELIPQGEQLAVAAAFLIPRGTFAAVRAQARALAASESVKLTVSGPFPPFSFAELEPPSATP